MAITVNGTKNSLPDVMIPTGYVKPVVTPITGAEYTRTLSLSIPKATVHNVSGAVTMANIIANATVGINKQIADILAADYLATANVTANGELVDLTSNLAHLLGDSAAFTDAATVYIATVILSVKAL
jgi:hypothetical protein